MQNKLLLCIGAILVLIGFLKPDFTSITLPVNVNEPACSVENYVTDAPSDDALLEKARAVTSIVQESDDSTRKSDCLKLSALYADMATLIELDDDKIIVDTSSIKEANSIAGKMLRLDIKGKYPDLAEAAKDVVDTGIGDDDVLLNPKLRTKAAECFRALSWAFYEGSK